MVNEEEKNKKVDVKKILYAALHILMFITSHT